MKWLYRILRLWWAPKCQHRWRYVSRIDYFVDGQKAPEHRPIWMKEIYECRKCGTPLVERL